MFLIQLSRTALAQNHRADGYFNGEYNGVDVTVKDSKRFAKTNGWGFFNFGHHPNDMPNQQPRPVH
jgi:hypothetical protein